MNNVTNRKMFRPRNARNKLNAMGGIMASSAPLMQSVQRFSNGTKVQVGGGQRPDPRTLNQKPDLFGITSSTLRNFLNNPFRAIVPQPTAQGAGASRNLGLSGIGSSDDAGLTPSRLSVKPSTTPAADLSIPDLPPVLDTTTSVRGSMDDAGLVPSQEGIMSVPIIEDAPYSGITSSLPRGSVKYVNTTPERIQRSMEITSGQRDFDQTIPGFFEDKKPAMQAEADRQLAEQRQITDPDRIAELEENTQGPGTTVAKPKTTKTEVKKSVAQNAPTTLEAQVGEIDQNAANFAQDIVNAAESLTSETDKNDLFLEVANKKKPEEKLSLKERFEKNKELASELGLFKGDPAEDKKIDGYNLAMMGFLIASGDSPNALSNIAKGAAAGTENFKKTAEARKERKDKLESFALTNAMADERAEIQWEREMEKYDKGLKYDWMKTVKASDDAKSQTVAKIASTRSNLMVQLANTSAEGRKERAFKLQYALFSNFDEAMPMAVYQAQEQGLNIGDQEVFDDVIMPNALKISDMLAQQKTKAVLPGQVGSPERTRTDALQRLVDLQRAGTTGAQYFDAQGGLTPAGQTALEQQMRYITEGTFTEAAPQTVTTREEYDALPSKTAYVDANGVPGVKP